MKFNKIFQIGFCLITASSLLFSQATYSKTNPESAYPETPPVSKAIGQDGRELDALPVPRNQEMLCRAPFLVPSATRDLLIDSYENIYLTREDKIFKVSKSDSSLIKMAGTGSGQDDGKGDNVGYKGIKRLAFDSSGNVYTIENPPAFHHSRHSPDLVRKMTPQAEVSTIAGNKKKSDKMNGTPANVSLMGLMDLLVDQNGDIYLTEFNASKIKKVSNGNVTTFAGSDHAGFRNGKAASAEFNGVDLLAKDHKGNLYVSDYFNNAIRKIDSKGNVTTFVSNVLEKTEPNPAEKNKITSMQFDANDNLYFTTLQSQKLWKVSSTGAVASLTGKERAGDREGSCQQAELKNPFLIRSQAQNDALYLVSNSKIKTVHLKSPNSCAVSTLALNAPCLHWSVVTPIAPGF